MNTVCTGLLGPYRVLDLTDDYGHLCGKILGDLGADVIKVERPCGSQARRRGPFVGEGADPERSLFWFAHNTSKRGITLNLECDEGQNIFRRLADKADFIIESFPPGYLSELGIGYEELDQLNPRVIVTSITPFGQSGPYRDLKCSELTIMAMGGLVWMCGDPDRAPVSHSLEQVHAQAGAQAAVASLIAHHSREIHGRGQMIDISIQECIAVVTGQIHHWWYYEGKVQSRKGTRTERGHLSPRVIFPCADGYVSWRLFTGSQGDKTRSLVELMALDGLAGSLDDIDWSRIDMDAVTQQQLESWEELFAEFFSRHPKQWLCREAAIRGIMLFPVNTVRELVQDGQLNSRDFWQPVDHPELGAKFIYPGAPFKVEGAAWSMRRRAPLIGEHNCEVYCGELGLSERDLDALRRKNVI